MSSTDNDDIDGIAEIGVVAVLILRTCEGKIYYDSFIQLFISYV